MKSVSETLKLFLPVLFFLVAAGSVYSQDDAESLFRKGLAGYRQEQYSSSEKDFRKLIGSFPDSPRMNAAQVMLAKALYRQGAFADADTVALALRSAQPNGPYAEWTYYFESACALRLGNAPRSLSLLAWLAGNARDERIKARSLRALRHTVIPLVDQDTAVAALREFSVAQSALEAAEMYDIEDIFDVEDDVTASTALVTGQAWRNAATIRVGLIVPLTGTNAEMGNRMLRGVRSVFAEQVVVDGKPVELVVEDSQSDPVVTVLKVRKLAEAGVVAIIGPVYSLSSITAAVEANSCGIPFVAPTATDMGLTDIGPLVFQLNFTPIVQAEALADFAVNTLAAKNVAVIASRDSWGKALAETFAREVSARGVHVVRTAFFTPDFESGEDKKIIRDIRARAPRPEAFTDSVGTVTFTAMTDTAMVDSTQYSSSATNAIDSVDAVLISATPSDAIRFATRITELKLITTLMGDSGWNYPTVPDEGKQALEGAYLVAPPGELSQGSGAGFLGNDLRKDDRDTVAMKGFDAASLLLRCIREGNQDPERIAAALTRVEGFKGASSLISIDPARRVNTAVEFVRIHDRKYERVIRPRNVQR